MKYTETQIRDGVRSLVASVTERNASEISDTADFTNDLGIDSVTAMELMVSMDKKYGIDIPEAEFTAIRSVNQAVTAVQRYVS